MRAHFDRADRATIAGIDQHRAGGHAGFPALAPLAKGDHRGQQRNALFGQLIFDLAAILGQRRALQNAVFGQSGEAIGEDVARDAQLRLKFLEMLQAVERRAQNEERPALPHRLQRCRQAAFVGEFAQGFAQLFDHGLAAYPKIDVREMPYKFQLATRNCTI